MPSTSRTRYYCDADGNIAGSSTVEPNFVMTNESGRTVIINGLAVNYVPESSSFPLAALALLLATAATRARRA
jgi:hypothetical protein